MDLEQALKEFGFDSDDKPSEEDVKKVYRSLANYFHPDKNPNEQKTAIEMMKIINEAYNTIGKNLDPESEWDFEDYIYVYEPNTTAARFEGYEGWIALRCFGATLYKVNRNLSGTHMEDPSTIGGLVNEHGPYDWYLKVDTEWGFRTDAEVGLVEFVLGIFQAEKSPYKISIISDDWRIVRHPEGIELTYSIFNASTVKREWRDTFLPNSDIELLKHVRSKGIQYESLPRAQRLIQG